VSRSQKQYLRDILDAMDKARRFADDVTFEDLEGDLDAILDELNDVVAA